MSIENIKSKIEECNDIQKHFESIKSKAEIELQQALFEQQFIPRLGMINSKVQETMSILKNPNVSPEDKMKALIKGMEMIGEFTNIEIMKIPQKKLIAEEKIKTITAVVSEIKQRSDQHEARIIAIERVAAGDVDPKRPERIAVVREAEKLKKVKQSDN
jgi:F0F1-type ATP synthase delta subunit